MKFRRCMLGLENAGNDGCVLVPRVSLLDILHYQIRQTSGWASVSFPDVVLVTERSKRDFQYQCTPVDFPTCYEELMPEFDPDLDIGVPLEIHESLRDAVHRRHNLALAGVNAWISCHVDDPE